MFKKCVPAFAALEPALAIVWRAHITVRTESVLTEMLLTCWIFPRIKTKFENILRKRIINYSWKKCFQKKNRWKWKTCTLAEEAHGIVVAFRTGRTTARAFTMPPQEIRAECDGFFIFRAFAPRGSAWIFGGRSGTSIRKAVRCHGVGGNFADGCRFVAFAGSFATNTAVEIEHLF